MPKLLSNETKFLSSPVINNFKFFFAILFICRFIKKCDGIYSKILYGNAVSSVLLIVINIILVMLCNAYSSGLMFSCTVLQCFLISFFGEIVKSASLNCTRAIYASKWYQLKSICDRKIVLFILMRLQMNIGFKAGGWIQVSMDMFKQVK